MSVVTTTSAEGREDLVMDGGDSIRLPHFLHVSSQFLRPLTCSCI